MRRKEIFVLVLAVLACCFVFTKAFAEEKKYELNTGSDIRDVLKENIGKKIVYIRLDSGEELSGWVVKVGDHLVHIAKITSMNFYDAVVRIDKISAVKFKVRGD